MRKMITLIMALTLVVNTTSAAFTETKTEHKETKSAFLFVEQRIATEFFSNLSRKDYEQLTGRHLSLLERIVFRWSQKHAHKNFGEEKQPKGFNPIGFFVPLLLGIIGVPLGLLAGLGFLGLVASFFGVFLIINFSKDKNMRKWAWIGFGTFATAFIALVIIILATGNFG